MTAGREASAESRLSPAAASTAPLPRVFTDGLSAVLLVDTATRRVVHANGLAQQLAPGLALPVPVDAWSEAAGLQDAQGRPLADTEHPLSLAASGVSLPGRAISALRASDSTGAREALFAVGLPLEGAPGLGGQTLVVLQPLWDAAAVWPTDIDTAAQRLARDRAVLATGCAFVLADATAPDLPLTWVNPSFTMTTGYRFEEVVGRNCRFLQGPDTDPESVRRLREALTAGRDATEVLLNYRKDGSTFWNQVTISPVLDAAGTVTHYVGIQSDVTERVEADCALERALQAERVARGDAELARAQAEAANRRLSLMAEASGLLAATLDVDESLDRVARLVVPLLADWVVINLADERGRPGPRTFTRHRDGHDELFARYRELVPSGVTPGSRLDALLAGGAPTLLARFAVPDVLTLTPAEQAIRQLSLALGTESVVIVPLTARRRVIGTMMLVHGVSGRVFDADDLDLAADLGRRAGLAVDNAQLFTREHTSALTLQRSLLPTLPETPGLALAAEYLPAGPANQVGGDWWDVFALPDGATGIAVGDVMGHDLAAAAAMGQLRSVLRTCAWMGEDPATVLDRMDRLVQSFDMAQLATCIYARLQPPDGPEGRRRTPRLVWSNAGHLPPVVLAPDGTVRLLTGAIGVPIGVPATEQRTHQSSSVPVGTTVLLYTDGLIETRRGDIDCDVRRLLDLVATHRPADGPQALVDRVLSSRAELTDDVALLAVQVLSP